MWAKEMFLPPLPEKCPKDITVIAQWFEIVRPNIIFMAMKKVSSFEA